MTSDTIWSDEILTGSKTFPLWKVKVTRRLHSGKVYKVVARTDTQPTPRTSVTHSDVCDWQEHDEKAHRIIQERLSDALLLKTASCASTKELWDKLLSLLNAPNTFSTFYIFQQLFNVAWDGNSRVSVHIATLQTSELCLTAMKFTIDSKVLAFILLNSLPKTLEWEIFKSSLINTVEESNLTFDAIETQIIAEDACLHPSRHSEFVIKASRAPKASIYYHLQCFTISQGLKL